MLRLSQALPIVILLLLFNSFPWQSQQTLTDLPIVQNGGFESGLSGWQQIPAPGGSVAVSNRVVHSGSAALAVGLAPPRPGANALLAIVEGVIQSSNATNLRGLRVGAWYLLQTNTYLVAVRVRIQVGSLTLNYYTVTSPNTVLTNSPKTKSMIVSPQNCAPWCLLQANVSTDIRSYFDPTAFAGVLQATGPIPIKIALEFLLYGGTDTQFMYWDDVELIASTPPQTTAIQTTTSTSSTSTQSRTTSTPQPQVIVSTSTSTLTSTATVGFVLTREQSYMVLVPAVALILIATLLELLRRNGTGKRKNTGKLGESIKTKKIVGSRCFRCGSILRHGDRFCDKCGARQ